MAKAKLKIPPFFCSWRESLEAFKSFLLVCGELVYLALYPSLIIYAVLALNLGVYGWLVIAGLLAPPTIVWLIVVYKRTKNYVALLLSNYKPRPIGEVIEEYLQLIRSDKKD